MSKPMRKIAKSHIGPRRRLGAGLAACGVLAMVVALPAAAREEGGFDPFNRDEDISSYYADVEGTRRVAGYSGRERAGTIIIDTSKRKLIYVLGRGRAMVYGVGVGREGFQWSGTDRVSRKAEWPGWSPPAEMLQRRPDLPRHMPGGPRNPLGARALYIGSSLYRIHGTNEADTIGQAMSSGCIRMLNQDVIDLYQRVKVGDKVIVRM